MHIGIFDQIPNNTKDALENILKVNAHLNPPDDDSIKIQDGEDVNQLPEFENNETHLDVPTLKQRPRSTAQAEASNIPDQEAWKQAAADNYYPWAAAAPAPFTLPQPSKADYYNTIGKDIGLADKQLWKEIEEYPGCTWLRAVEGDPYIRGKDNLEYPVRMGQDLTYWVENITWPDHPYDERVAFMLTENQVKHLVSWKKKDTAKGAGLLNRHGQKTSKQERKNAFLMQEMF